jgi:hypothetical protein
MLDDVVMICFVDRVALSPYIPDGKAPSCALSEEYQVIVMSLFRGGVRSDDPTTCCPSYAVNLDLEYPRKAAAKMTGVGLGRALRSFIALQSCLAFLYVSNGIALTQKSIMSASVDAFP